MHAVVVTGGKQYRVTAGDKINVEKLVGNTGDIVKIDQVLTLSGEGANEIGTPTVANAVVEAQIIAQFKGDKVIVFKKKRRHNYRRKNGHRQLHTALHITAITLGGKSLAKAEALTVRDNAQLLNKKPVKAANTTAPKAKAAANTTEKKKAAAKNPAAKKTAKATKAANA